MSHTQHVAAVLWAMARLRAPEPTATRAAASRLDAVLPTAPLSDVGSALQALAAVSALAARAAAAGGGRQATLQGELGAGLLSRVVRATAKRLPAAAVCGEAGGRQLAMLLYGLHRWAAPPLLPRRNFLNAWMAASGPRLREWAPRDVAISARVLGGWRVWGGPQPSAWAAAALDATQRPELLARLNGADAVGLLVGLAGMQLGAERRARDVRQQAARTAALARRSSSGSLGSIDGGTSSGSSGGGSGGGVEGSSARSSGGPFSPGGEGSPAAGDGDPEEDGSRGAALVVVGEAGVRWWAAYQAATLVLLPALTLSEVTALLAASSRARLVASPEWVLGLGRRGLELASAAAPFGRSHGAACLLLAAVGRAARQLPPDAAAEARGALAPAAAGVAAALTPHLATRSGAIDLVQLMSGLAGLGVRPGPALAAAAAAGLERRGAGLTPGMWRQVRDAYVALRLAPTNALVRAFLVHVG
jgi:hypothetical protein